MNREEAIKHLETYSTTNGSGQTTQAQHEEAKRMAIKALEQEPKTDSWSIKDVADTFKKHGLIRVQEPSGNAINRKLVCAFLSGLISDETERKKALQYINELPSVNPMPCGDAISRQAVRHILNHEVKMPIKVWKKVFELVDDLPPVTPQPKTGYWIFDDECKEHGHCSRCGYGSVDLVDGDSHNYCRNCGAWMIEPQESEDI